jgi:hypothetical protein
MLQAWTSMAPGVKLTPELTAWLATCPDPVALQNVAFCAAKHACAECKELFPRRDLRMDRTGPLSSEELLCRLCWEDLSKAYVHGARGDPHFRSPPWPEDEPQTEDTLVDGVIVTKAGVRVGFAEGYDQDSHFARRVTLLESPEFAEPGTLEDGDVVVERTQHVPERQLSWPEILERVM